MCTMARDVVVRSALCLLDDTRTCLLSQIYTYFQDLLLEGMSLQIYTYFQANFPSKGSTPPSRARSYLAAACTIVPGGPQVGLE